MDKNTLEQVANLARIKVKESNTDEFCEAFNGILSHFDKISSIDTEGTTPLVTPHEMKLNFTKDVVVDWSEGAKAVLDKSPDQQDSHYRVPPVVS